MNNDVRIICRMMTAKDLRSKCVSVDTFQGVSNWLNTVTKQ